MAGLKKCNPINLSLFSRELASAVIDKDEVFDEIIHFSSTNFSIFEKISFFRSRFSIIASIMSSEFLRPLMSVENVRFFLIFFMSSFVYLPLSLSLSNNLKRFFLLDFMFSLELS